MRIAVTGRHGLLARALAEAGSRSRSVVDVMTIGRPHIDLCRLEALPSAIEACEADVIVNAAAFMDVDAIEHHRDTALLVNGAAAGAIAATGERLGIPIIQISCADVFDGTSSAPYAESDMPAPHTIYGASKLLGEQLVAASTRRHLILRTSWLFGDFENSDMVGAVARGRPGIEDTVIESVRFSPTYAPILANAILTMALAMNGASAADGRWGVYNICNAGDATAEEIADAFAQCINVGSLGPSAQPTRLVRPRATGRHLTTEKYTSTFGTVLPHWRLGVQELADRLRG